MYRLRRKIAAFLALVVMFTTNIGIQMLPQSMRSAAEEHLIPVAAAASSSIKVAVNAGEHSMAIKSDGTVSCWGSNTYGKLGDGTDYTQSTPVNVKGIDNVVAVSSVKDCSYAVKSDGTVWKWGKVESYCPLGTPVKVEGLQDIVDIKAATNFYNGAVFFMALKSDGTVWSWGKNSSGQLGIGSEIINYTPTQVPDLTDVIAIAAGGLHAVALKSDGTVWCWGGNNYGQLGNGTTNSSNIPVKVPGLSGITQIAADGYHTLALKGDGTVWGWGDSAAVGENSDLKSPKQFDNFSGAAKIAAGEKHCVVVKKDGTVWTLGQNNYGQRGTSNTTSVAIKIEGLTDITDVSALNNYNLAIKNDGSVYSWGQNDQGALGVSATTSYRSKPAVVSGFNLFSTAQGKPEGVLLNKTSLIKTVGETERLLATVTPSAITATGISWSILNDNGIVSLSEDGLVTALKPGTCEIIAASAVDPNKYAECTVTVLEPVQAADLVLNTSSMAIDLGMSKQLTATIEPMNVTNKGIDWSVTSGGSNVSVANGRVTAVKIGQAVVRAQSRDNPLLYKECNVTVTNQAVIETTGIITIDDYISLLGEIYPTQNEDTYKFTVSKTGTYRISSLSNPEGTFLDSDLYLNGSTTAQHSTFIQTLTAGTAYTIKIKMSDWSEVCSYKLNIEFIKIPVSSVNFSEKTAVLNIGETKQLTPSVAPSNAYNKEVTWSIPTDSGIVAVSPSGVVTALKAGTTTVRATSVSNSNIYGDCTIIVDDYGNTTTSASAVEEDTPIHGEINPARANICDSDYFVFTAKDTGWYNIATTTESSLFIFAPTVTVYDANSNQVSCDPNDWDQWKLVSGNKYYVKVQGVYSSDIGGYTLDIRSLTVHVTEITLPYENDTFEIEPGLSAQLLTKILPSDATNKNVIWSLVNETVSGTITITPKGELKALKDGTAKVKATSVENSTISKECTVIVKDYANTTTAALDIQENDIINGAIGYGDCDWFKFTPSKSGIYNITSTSTSVDFQAEVSLYDSNGKVIASDYSNTYSPSATLTEPLNGGSIYYIKADRHSIIGTYSLKVEYTVIPVNSITLNKDKFLLEMGQTTQASVTISPDLVSNRNIIWTVPTGGGIVAVSTSGSIEALAPGKAIVRATCEDNSSIYKDCAVTVTTVGDYGDDIDSPYIISDNTTIQGIIEPAGETDCVKFTATKTCYYRMSGAGDTLGSSFYFKLYDKYGYEIKPNYTYSDYILLKMNSGDICYVKLGMSNSTETGGYAFSVRPHITMDYLSGFEMLPDTTRSLTVGILPSDEKVIWSVESGKEFVSLSANNLTALKEGKAVIRATSANNPTLYRECTVTVDYGKDKSTAYTVEYNKSINGTFSSSGDLDYFKITPASDIDVAISAEFETGTSNIGLKVTSGDYTYTASSTYNNVRMTLYKNTTYCIELDPWGSGNYIFKIGAPLDSVTILQSHSDMGKGQTLKLDAIIGPSSAANMFVDWSVKSGSSVVKVSSTGEVTALTTGSAIVKATSRGTDKFGDKKTAECEITVYDTDFIGVTGINVSPLSIDLPRRMNIQLNAVISPDNATNKNIYWSVVSGQDYIYFPIGGLVSPHYPGTAVVRATSKSNPLVYKDITINVLDDDFSDTTDLAYSLVEGKETNGEIRDRYDIDYFKLIPSKTGGYTINLYPNSTSLYLSKGEIHLYDSKGNQIGYGENVIKRNLEANQTYFVEVKVQVGERDAGYYTIKASPMTNTELELSSNYIYMVPEQNKQLDLSIYTPDGSDRQAAWSVTEGSDIVSVSSTGLVTSLKPGYATVKATCDGANTWCVVTVYADDYGNTTSTAVTINENTTVNGKREVYNDYDYFKFIPSKTGTYTLETTGSGAVLQHLNIYESNGTEIAETYSTISKELKAGHTYFMRMSGGNEGDYTLKITLSKASVPVNGITLSQNSVQLKQGGTHQLEVTVSPSEAANKDVVWSVTSGSEFISVSESGRVTALEPGMAKIRVASTDDLNIYAECDVTVTHVTVAGINLSPASITMTPQEEKQLIAEVLPVDATNKAVVWSVTSGNGIVSVSETGKVAAINPGTAKIRVASAENQNIFDECEVTVTPVTVAGIKLSTTSITLTPQEEKQLTVEVLPIDATNKAVVWSVTSGNEIILVSETGKVTAIKQGTAKIRVASAEDESIYAECDVTVEAGSSNPGMGNASISMQNEDYKNADISVTITFNGNLLDGVYDGDKKLVEGQDYVLSDIVKDGTTTVSAICTIKNSYLMTLPKEQTTKLTFDFDKGNDSELSVTVPKLDECFIATAAFGSKLQPAVALLRQFRDQCLLTNRLGTKFVNFYYKNSPPIAQFIAGNDTLRGIVRGLLLPFIAIAYGIMHPVVGCLGLIVIIFAAVMWRKRSRRLVNM